MTCLLQDRTGFLWVGTTNGLNKFDGYHFTSYKNRQGNRNSLSNNTINALLEDRNGFVWVATMDGLNRFDPRTETFRQYRSNPADPKSIFSNETYSIAEDKAGFLWVGAATTLDRLDPETGVFTHFQPPTGPAGFAGDKVLKSIVEFDSALYFGRPGCRNLAVLPPDRRLYPALYRCTTTGF